MNEKHSAFHTHTQLAAHVNSIEIDLYMFRAIAITMNFILKRGIRLYFCTNPFHIHVLQIHTFTHTFLHENTHTF